MSTRNPIVRFLTRRADNRRWVLFFLLVTWLISELSQDHFDIGRLATKMLTASAALALHWLWNRGSEGGAA